MDKSWIEKGRDPVYRATDPYQAGDATAALSFDGTSFSGSILKIRRPKDFVESADGDEAEDFQKNQFQVFDKFDVIAPSFEPLIMTKRSPHFSPPIDLLFVRKMLVQP